MIRLRKGLSRQANIFKNQAVICTDTAVSKVISPYSIVGGNSMKQALGLHQSDKLLIPFIDYLFWILLILYTNPGGIFQALNIWHVVGRFNINDLLFVFLSICYVVIPKGNNLDSDFKKVRNYLFFFLVYYFIVFVYLIPLYNANKDYSLLIALIKSRWTLYSIFLFIYIYEFFKRRSDVFLKFFIYSSVFILILFLLQIIINVNILPIELTNRGFVNMNRLYNTNISDSLMRLLIPMGITVFVFKSETKYKNMILIGFIIMVTYYVVSITRRDIIGILIYFILAIIIDSFIKGYYMVLLSKTLKSALVIIFITIGVYFIFPKYLEATRIGIVETINIIETGKETGGYKDERMGLRPFIVLQFIKHPLLGTGFDNRWRTSEGDKLGFEASDYPFLAALAMFGIIGNIIFLPVYILLLKYLKNDLKHLQSKKNKNKSLSYILLLTFILYFTYDFLQYWNYFLPVSNAWQYWWYSSLAFYLATRHQFYSTQIQNQTAPKLSLNLT